MPLRDPRTAHVASPPHDLQLRGHHGHTLDRRARGVPRGHCDGGERAPESQADAELVQQEHVDSPSAEQHASLWHLGLQRLDLRRLPASIRKPGGIGSGERATDKRTPDGG